MTYQELNFAISVCKQNLKLTDYKAIKYAEGLISEEDYAPIKKQRNEWREQINEYEGLLPEAKTEWEDEVNNFELEEPSDSVDFYEFTDEEDAEADV